MRRALVGVVTLSLCSVAIGCSHDGDGTTLTIFAASSLMTSFSSLESRFEETHPDVDVVLSFGSSTTLAQQIAAGAPADVIATADGTSMSVVSEAGHLSRAPEPFATNSLIIAVPHGNPGDVTGVESLSSTDFVMCAATAPCGSAAAALLRNAGVSASPRSFEPDVASVLTKVELHEADAGIVYVTDARSAPDEVDGVPVPAADNVVNTYFIAPVSGSDESSLAGAWVDLVQSSAGQAVLAEAGFGRP